MIDVAGVRNRLIEKAIRGELSNRIGSKEDVDALLISIETERLALLKKKETKISKASEMINEGIFNIPNTWKWVSLGKVCIMLSRGKSPKYSESKKYPVFAQKCNQPNELALSKAQFLDETTLAKWPDYFRLREKDIVINSTGTGTMGRIGYYVTDTLNPEYPFMLPDSHITVVRAGSGIVSKYLYYALKSASLQTIMEKQFRGSTNQKEFYIDSVYSMPIPLPPVEEQQLITNKLDEAFNILKFIEHAQNEYAVNTKILKNKLINAGIQGKLTKQFPEDGNTEDLYSKIQAERMIILERRKGKEDKKIKAVESDVPFKIPSHWKWIRLGNIGLFKKGPFGSALTKSMFVQKGMDTVKVYEQQHAIKKDWELGTYYITREYFNEKMSGFEVMPGDIIVSCAGTIGETYIMPDEIEQGIINQALMRVTLAEGIDKKFFQYYFDANLKKSAQEESNGSAIKNIPPFDVLKNWYFPLTSIEEQRRIVSKIDEILACM